MVPVPSDRAAALAALLDPGLPVWLLIDPMLGEPLPYAQGSAQEAKAAVQQRRSDAWGRDVQGLRVDAAMLAPCQQPYLVALQGLGDPWLAYTLNLAHQELAVTREDGLAGTGRGPHAMGGWLQTQASGEALATSLNTVLRLKAPRFTEARYLRLADRRTLDALDALLGRSAWTATLGAMRRWVWLDGLGRLACAEVASDLAAQPITFTLDDWRDFQLAPLVNPTLARWLGTAPAAGPSDIPHAWHQALLALRQAQHAAQHHPRHLDREADVLAHAVLALLHPGFEATPATQQWLATDPTGGDFEPLHQHCHTLHAALAATPKAPP